MKKLALLDEARAIRSRAVRTRRLAKATTDADATKAILAYAENLERRATNLEAKARELRAADEHAPAADDDFSRTLRDEIDRTRATVNQIHHSLASDPNDRKDEGEPC
jgi:predicted  nucleic acid-binding Zn-ribbon protein